MRGTTILMTGLTLALLTGGAQAGLVGTNAGATVTAPITGVGLESHSNLTGVRVPADHMRRSMAKRTDRSIQMVQTQAQTKTSGSTRDLTSTGTVTATTPNGTTPNSTVQNLATVGGGQVPGDGKPAARGDGPSRDRDVEIGTGGKVAVGKDATIAKETLSPLDTDISKDPPATSASISSSTDVKTGKPQ